jgi:hypothetical protein
LGTYWARAEQSLCASGESPFSLFTIDQIGGSRAEVTDQPLTQRDWPSDAAHARIAD